MLKREKTRQKQTLQTFPYFGEEIQGKDKVFGHDFNALVASRMTGISIERVRSSMQTCAFLLPNFAERMRQNLANLSWANPTLAPKEYGGKEAVVLLKNLYLVF